jgi:nucleosome binding factor SPN SPT16 subunit
MEFRDGTYVLSPKNTRTLKANMTLNLGLGFSDLSDKNGNKYALHLVDTIRVDSAKSVLLTDGVKSSKETLFFLDAPSDAEKPKKKPPVQPKANGAAAAKVKTVGGKVLRNQRAAQDEVRQGALSKLVEHQRDLHEQLQQNGMEKFSEGGGGTGGKEGKSWKKFQSYKGDGGLPNEAEKLRVFVDRKAQSVILPIHGFAVPFHINVIKNASKSDEGDFTYLRINFQTPGQLAGKKEDTVRFPLFLQYLANHIPSHLKIPTPPSFDRSHIGPQMAIALTAWSSKSLSSRKRPIRGSSRRRRWQTSSNRTNLSKSGGEGRISSPKLLFGQPSMASVFLVR